MKQPSLINLLERERCFLDPLGLRYSTWEEELPKSFQIFASLALPSGETRRPLGHQRILPPHGCRQRQQRGWRKRCSAGEGGSGAASSALCSAVHRHLRPPGPPLPCGARSGAGANRVGISREKPSGLQPEEEEGSPDPSTPGRAGDFWETASATFRSRSLLASTREREKAPAPHFSRPGRERPGMPRGAAPSVQGTFGRLFPGDADPDSGRTQA